MALKEGSSDFGEPDHSCNGTEHTARQVLVSAALQVFNDQQRRLAVYLPNRNKYVPMNSPPAATRCWRKAGDSWSDFGVEQPSKGLLNRRSESPDMIDADSGL